MLKPLQPRFDSASVFVVVKTLMLYAACHWGLEYDMEGVGYLAVLHLNRATNYRLCAPAEVKVVRKAT